MSKLPHLIFMILLLNGCKKQDTPNQNNDHPDVLNPPSKNVVVLVIDGARLSETFKCPSRKYIPGINKVIRPNGTLSTNFTNEFYTETMEGHIAMFTGTYEYSGGIGGTFPPSQPSIFNYWLKNNNNLKEKAWIITSKDKLELMASTIHEEWDSTYLPSTFCGKLGIGNGSGYGSDSITFEKTLDVLKNQKPNLLLVSFMEPDVSGHNEDWEGYLSGLKKSDYYVTEIWQYLQKSDYYKENTTIFITNDHGRHLDENGGFGQHGDDCAGCKDIFLLVTGPNVEKGGRNKIHRELIDISATVANLLDFDMASSKGKVMEELFQKNK